MAALRDRLLAPTWPEGHDSARRSIATDPLSRVPRPRALRQSLGHSLGAVCPGPPPAAMLTGRWVWRRGRVFIEEYLQDLRRDRFSLPAIVTYARRSAGRARESLVANPGAVRSLWSLALLYFVIVYAGAAGMALTLGRPLAHDF